MRWKISSGRLIGRLHREKMELNQDFISVRPMDDFACMVAADGASVARYAREGASFTTERVRELLVQHKEGIFSYSDDEIKSLLLSSLHEGLGELAARENVCIDEYMCTLMFFACNEEKYIAANLGDGLLGCMSGNGKGSVLIMPEQGKFANESCFVTQDDAFKHLRIVRGAFECDKVYFMMTDGAASCLYDFREQHFAKAMNVFCDWVRKYDAFKVGTYITDAMIKLFPSKTSDDCTVALICGLPVANNG